MILACDDLGQGATVMLLHAFPLDRTAWRPVADRLCTRRRVILPDLGGFGASMLPARRAGVTSTHEEMADDVADTLDALGVDEPITLGGLSLGGYVAPAFLERHPHRVGALILCDTRADADPEEARERRRALADQIDALGSARVAAVALVERLFARSTIDERPELVSAWRERMAAMDAYAVAAASRGMALRPARQNVLERLHPPTLAIVGEHDVVSSPAVMRALVASVPGAALEVIAHAGHLAPIERPEAVAAVIEAFLDACGR